MSSSRRRPRRARSGNLPAAAAEESWTPRDQVEENLDDDARDELIRKIQDLEQQLERMEENMAEHDGQIGDCHELCREFRAMRDDFDNSDRRVNMIEATLGKLSDQIAEREAENQRSVQSLRDELSDAPSGSRRQNDATIRNLRRDLVDFRTQYAADQGATAEKHRNAGAEMEDLRTLIDELSTTVEQNMQESIDQLIAKGGERQKAIEDLQVQCAAQDVEVRSAIEKLRSELCQASTENEKTIQALQAHDLKIETLGAFVKTLKSESTRQDAAARTSMQKLRDDLEELRSAVARTDPDPSIQALQAEFEALKSRSTSQQAEHERTMQQLHDEIEGLRAGPRPAPGGNDQEYRSLLEAVAQIQARLANEREQPNGVSDLLTQVQQLRERPVATLADLEKLGWKLENSVTPINTRLERLGKMVEDVRRDAEKKSREIDAAVAVRLKDHAERLKKSIQDAHDLATQANTAVTELKEKGGEGQVNKEMTKKERVAWVVIGVVWVFLVVLLMEFQRPVYVVYDR
jgi:chromosome segregation ATPase